MDNRTPSALAAAKLQVMGSVGYVQKLKGANLNYTYAGETALIAALRPAMLEHGLTVAPVHVEIRQEGHYQTVKGALMYHVLVAVTYRLTHAPSGEHEDAQVLGEASDWGDKAAGKALTGAFKYFLRQSFVIETGDDPDRTPSRGQERAPENGPPTAPAAEPFAARLASYDARLAKAGLCQVGDCTKHVRDAGRVAKFPESLAMWDDAQQRFGIATAKGFEAMKRKAQPSPTTSEKGTQR